MRGINISNEKKRDTEVAFESILQKSKVKFVLGNGAEKQNIKILKSTIELSDEALVKKYGTLKALGEAIIESDPELDVENIGRKIGGTHKLYLNKDNKIAYRVNRLQIVRTPDGEEKERKDLTKVVSNIIGNGMVQWSGKKIPKEVAIRKFVFVQKYQIKHVNGLTYDFLYAMAKELHESKSLMFVGAGEKGNEPLIITSGGIPYRAFLEGRIDGDKYCLILHLTNIEIKTLNNNDENI
ncbi:MAG: hypothetical protein LBS55_07075 [Prevotellaceae bacterium]|jgi:hypothetical protein|nr:hypothetical protein [Prevotellaceae bacterium]